MNENQYSHLMEDYLNKHPVIMLRLPKILKSCKAIDQVENDIYDYYNKEIKSTYPKTFE